MPVCRLFRPFWPAAGLCARATRFAGKARPQGRARRPHSRLGLRFCGEPACAVRRGLQARNALLQPEVKGQQHHRAHGPAIFAPWPKAHAPRGFQGGVFKVAARLGRMYAAMAWQTGRFHHQAHYHPALQAAAAGAVRIVGPHGAGDGRGPVQLVGRVEGVALWGSGSLAGGEAAARRAGWSGGRRCGKAFDGAWGGPWRRVLGSCWWGRWAGLGLRRGPGLGGGLGARGGLDGRGRRGGGFCG